MIVRLMKTAAEIKPRRLRAVLALLLWAWPAAVSGQERVISFEVTAALQRDASLIVTERIRVHIEQKIIRQGITHAFPVKQRYDGLKLRHYGFELISVKLDGKKVHYHHDEQGYYRALAIGRAGVGAPLGEHTYEIVYQTDGHVLPLEDRDEIYYNVMGHNWELPVELVSFTLLLPGDRPDGVIEAQAFTGAPGQTGQDYLLAADNTIRSARTLAPGEGLTVAMAWEKGLVRPPEESVANIVGANRPLALGGLLAVTFLYFGAVRLIFSRRPFGVVTPLFHPPEGLSPGYAASLKSMAYEGRLLHADIVWAAVNGFFRLDARGRKQLLLCKNIDPGASEPVKSGGQWAQTQCRQLSRDLFGRDSTRVDLRSGDGRDKASLAFENLRERYAGRQKGFWTRSYIPALIGFILFLFLFNWIMPYIYSPMLEMGEDYGGAVGYLFILWALWGLIAGSLYVLHRALTIFDGHRRLAILILVPLPALGSAAVLWVLSGGDYFFLGVVSAALGLMSWFAVKPPTRITPKGRDKYLQILGLEMYIRTAETHRLAKLNAPEDTVEKFEELLPYAVALDCAEAWRKRFEKVLLELRYEPRWMEMNKGPMSCRQIFRPVTGRLGLAAATRAGAKLSQAVKDSQASGSRSASARAGGGSGFSGGSAGGGSGGSSVGGW